MDSCVKRPSHFDEDSSGSEPEMTDFPFKCWSKCWKACSRVGYDDCLSCHSVESVVRPTSTSIHVMLCREHLCTRDLTNLELGDA